MILFYFIKGNAQFAQKVNRSEFKQNHHRNWKYYKSCYFYVFITKVIKTYNYFFVTVLFNFFMGQALTNYFWGLQKNINISFPLNEFLPFNTKYHKCAD